MKISVPTFDQLPRDRGRHQLAMDIAGEQVPIYWQRGKLLHPCVVVTAMVHGDEFEGFVAAINIWKWAQAVDIKGSLMILPICNPAAAHAATRHTPITYDGLNLARTFPGASDSGYTEQLAHAIWQLIQQADVLIDLHSGGVGYDYARLAGYYCDTDADLSACFPEAFLWPVPPTPGVLSYEFSRLNNKVSLGWECGGEARLDRVGSHDYTIGIQRVLAKLGLIANEEDHQIEQSRSRIIGDTFQQVSRSAGWFLPETAVGSYVDQGQVFGEWIGSDLSVSKITSQHSGLVIALRTLPRVESDDYLALIAEPSWDYG